jgi:hypothetical protein
MSKLILNLSSRPRLDFRRIGPLFLGLTLATLFFTGLGIYVIHDHTETTRTLTTEIEKIQEKSADFSDLSAEVKKKITEAQSRWLATVNLVNGLISRKTFSFTTLLDHLEKLIPEGVIVNNLVLSNSIPPRIRIPVEAVSFEKLMEVYKNLSDLGLATSGESEKNGLYTATVEFDIKL